MVSWVPSQEASYVIGAVAIICGSGIFQLCQQRKSFEERRAFAVKFRSQLHIFANNPATKRDIYEWLIANSPQMQREIGHFGIYQNFRHRGDVYLFYEIVLNALPEANRLVMRDISLFWSDINQYIRMIDDALLRYIGDLDYNATHHPSLRNPVFWFREGVRAWLTLPLTLLTWFGVLSTRTVSRWTAHSAFKAFTGIAGFVGFVSAVFTITLGWTDMLKFVWKLLGR